MLGTLLQPMKICHQLHCVVKDIFPFTAFILLIYLLFTFGRIVLCLSNTKLFIMLNSE